MQPNTTPNPFEPTPTPSPTPVPSQTPAAAPAPIAAPTLTPAPVQTPAPFQPQAPVQAPAATAFQAAPQPAAPQPVAAAYPADDSKTIKNAGRSSLAVGIFMGIISIFGIYVAVSDDQGIAQIIITVVCAILFSLIAVRGALLKKSPRPRLGVTLLMTLSFTYILIAIAGAFITDSIPVLGIVIAIVLGIYLAVARKKIHATL